MTNLSSFDFNLLKTLDAMLRTGTTQAAGEKIGLSQPAVSAALARLRAQLNDPLFVRQGQRLTPTDFARSLEGPLQEALALVETVLAGPAGFDPSTADFEFRMSGSDFFSEVLIPPLLARLRDVAPGVSVHLLDMVFTSTLHAVETFDIDLVFWPRFDKPSHLVGEDIMTSDFITCAPVGHPRLQRAGVGDGDPVPLDLYCDLDHAHFLPEPNILTQIDAALAARGRARRVAASLPSFGGVYAAVADGGLIGYLPRRIAEARHAAGKITLHPMPLPIETNYLTMFWHVRLSEKPSHKWMRGQICDILGPYSDNARPDGSFGSKISVI